MFERIDKNGSPQEVSINAARELINSYSDNKSKIPTTYYICSSKNYADALVVIPLIGRNNGILILLDEDTNLDELINLINSSPIKIEKLVFVGGTNSVSKEIEQSLINRYR